MSEEEWRPFREGTYDVSSLGNIRRAKPGIATFVGRPVRPNEGPTGYSQVCLSVPNGRQQRFYVHRLVAEAFLGACPVGYVVNHIDANKRNNVLANLEYVSCRENYAHALRVVGRHKGPIKPKAPPKGPQTGDAHWSRRNPSRVARGERMGGSKLKTEQVEAIKTRAANGEKQLHLAREFGVSIAQVSRIVRGLRWAHMGGPR